MNGNAKKWTERNIQKQEGLDRQKGTYEKKWTGSQIYGTRKTYTDKNDGKAKK